MDSAHSPQVLANKTMEEEGKAKPAAKDQTLNCPRCNSINTKFCYYNNYSLSQPRYFCKSCRRYWTAGGSLRNIPVGGASRKNKRSTSSPSISVPSTSSAKKKEAIDGHLNPTSSPAITSFSSSLLSDMDQMLSIRMPSREPIPFIPIPAVQDSGNLHEFKPSFNISADGFQSELSGARNLFGVEDLKQVSVMDSEGDQNGGKLGDVGGFWNGFFGGGSW